MTETELIESLSKWIGEITDAPPPALTSDTHLVNDLALDSLSLAELAARVRRELGIALRPTELANDLRVGALVKLAIERRASG